MTTNKTILIVGGGSAGWMSAGYYSKKGYDVTLVESDQVPIVGVGESTLPAMNHFCQDLGLDESDWMPASHAIYKLGIDHQGWSGPGSSWWHWFLYDRKRQESQHNFIKTRTFPEQHKLEYGYHVDSIEFGQAIAKPIAFKNGCKHIIDHIDEVKLDADGNVDCLVTASGNILKADYYIDCSGWAKILTKAVGTKYEPYTDIINDRAIACPQPSIDPIKNYTITTKKSAGWMWEIALTNRRGTGYVYSSKHITDDQAIAEYCEHYPGTDKNNIRFLRFSPEKCINPFNKNVLAVGLSAGFIEPLEATSMWAAQYNIMNFHRVISENRNPEVFNRAQRTVMDEIYLYILAHYTLIADESNDYWKHYADVEKQLNTNAIAKQFASQPDTMKYKGTKLFFPYNWWAMLKGYKKI
jgi:tryptophan halogenase